MNTRNVNEIFIGDGAALTAGGVNIAALTGQLSFVNQTMVTPNATTTTTAISPTLYVVNRLANGDLKRSMPIKGANIYDYKGQSYVPATKEVWAIGHNRLTGVGTIEVNNSTSYNFAISFKWDKQMYSERLERIDLSFTSAAAATQLTIATQIAALINGSAQGSAVSGVKTIAAIVVGDGTGALGLTGATDYGVEITALDVNQFANTTYKPIRVVFSCHVNDASGFGTTSTCTQIQANSFGTGTLEQVSGLELFNYQFEGVLNRTKFPIPSLPQLTATSLTQSGVLAAFTVTTVATEDVATFSAAAQAQLPAGSTIVVDLAGAPITYVIKYWISTTVAVLTTIIATADAAVQVAGKAGYDIINISVNDVTHTAGANIGQISNKEITIASPAIISTATAMTTASTGTAAILAFFGTTYMGTTPMNPLCTATTINGVTI